MNQKRNSNKHKILVNGPRIGLPMPSINEPKGGVVTAYRMLLSGFQSDNFSLKPCFYTLAQKGHSSTLSSVNRLFRDIFTLIINRPGSSGLHIFGQYRTAIYREFILLSIARIMFLPVLYQIRAGEFINWYEGTSRIQNFLTRYILNKSRVIICEGQPYVEFLQKNMKLKSTYFPNYVLKNEIPTNIPKRLTREIMSVIYTGAIVEQKGVWQTVLACNEIAKKGINIKLTLVGNEHPDMTLKLGNLTDLHLNFELVRTGAASRSEIMSLLKNSDIFCMPSRYPGEGHSNAVNEAMMWGLVIICTRQGFLETILGENGAYLLDKGNKNEIVETLDYIHNNRKSACERAHNARQRLISFYNSDQAFANLENVYNKLVCSRSNLN